MTADAKPAFDPTKPVEGFLELDAAGRWLYKGEPITHPGLVSILESNYARDDEGRYIVSLKLPGGVQKVLVTYADTPYFVKDVDVVEGGVVAALNDGRRIGFDGARLQLRGAGKGYLRVTDDEWAAFTRKAALRLADLLEERDGRLGLVASGGWKPIEAPAAEHPGD